MTRKQKAESKAAATDQTEQPTKKAKQENETDNGKTNGKPGKEYEDFCRAISEDLSVDQMKEILQLNGQEPSGPEDAIIARWYAPMNLVKSVVNSCCFQVGLCPVYSRIY